MTCRFPNCTRDARRGWTTCARHYTAGRCLAQDRRAKADEQRRALACPACQGCADCCVPVAA